jgi:hypothetical protein
MPEEKVTEGKETEEKAGDFDTWVHQYPEYPGLAAGKLVPLHGLLKECVSLARETVEAEFSSFADDPNMQGTIAEMTGPLAAALFHRAATPDQTETMLVALEKGLEWFEAREEKQKAASAKISAEFQNSIGAVLPKPPRRRSPTENLVQSLLNFASDYAMEQFRRQEEEQAAEVEKPIKTFTQEKGSPTPEE